MVLVAGPSNAVLPFGAAATHASALSDDTLDGEIVASVICKSRGRLGESTGAESKISFMIGADTVGRDNGVEVFERGGEVKLNSIRLDSYNPKGA